MRVLVLLLTALVSTLVFAIPTPRVLSQYPRRDESGTLLEMIAQYKQVKLEADEAEQMKNKLLAEAQTKKLEIEKSIGFTNDSITSTATPRPTARTASGLLAETYTILTATGSAVVFANQGTTRTVSLNQSSTVAPSLSFPNPSVVSSPMSMNSTVPSLSSASSNPVPLTTVLSTPACSTPTTFLTKLSSQESSTAKANNLSSNVPVTVLAATGSVIVLASQGLTSTVNVAVSPSRPTGST